MCRGARHGWYIASLCVCDDLRGVLGHLRRVHDARSSPAPFRGGGGEAARVWATQRGLKVAPMWHRQWQILVCVWGENWTRSPWPRIPPRGAPTYTSEARLGVGPISRRHAARVCECEGKKSIGVKATDKQQDSRSRSLSGSRQRTRLRWLWPVWHHVAKQGPHSVSGGSLHAPRLRPWEIPSKARQPTETGTHLCAVCVCKGQRAVCVSHSRLARCVRAPPSVWVPSVRAPLAGVCHWAVPASGSEWARAWPSEGAPAPWCVRWWRGAVCNRACAVVPSARGGPTCMPRTHTHRSTDDCGIAIHDSAQKDPTTPRGWRSAGGGARERATCAEQGGTARTL